MRIVDDDGAEVAVGTVGELWTRSAQNMLGYWNNPDATAATVTADGWLKTGDAGYVDDDGYLYLHDRVKDMIVSGGENVYPAEVENVLMTHPGVADVAVIGVPDEKWGEAVKAVVVPAAGTAPTEAELIAFARERLAGFKLPKSVDFAEALPRNPSGKLLKRALREPYWAGVEPPNRLSARDRHSPMEILASRMLIRPADYRTLADVLPRRASDWRSPATTARARCSTPASR